jgi:hypothetical protein
MSALSQMHWTHWRGIRIIYRLPCPASAGGSRATAASNAQSQFFSQRKTRDGASMPASKVIDCPSLRTAPGVLTGPAVSRFDAFNPVRAEAS